MDGDHSRFTCFDRACFRRQFHRMNLPPCLNVLAAELCDFPWSSPGVSAKPRHPPFANLETSFWV